MTGFLGYADTSLGADFLMMPTSLVLSGGNVGAGPELAEGVRETPGVSEVTTLRLAMSTANGAPLQVIGVDPVTYPAMAGLEFSGGAPATAFTALGEGRSMIINGFFAAQQGARVGDILRIQTPEGLSEYQVAGIGTDYLNAKLASGYVSHENLAEDFNQTNDLLLMANVAPGADMAEVQAALEGQIQGYPAFTLVESASWRATQRSTISAAMSIFYVLMTVLALPSLLALMNTVAMNVMERTREIGVIRATGGSRRQVQRIILAESLLLAATGTALGLLAGVWLGRALLAALNSTGFAMPYAFPAAGLLVGIAAGLLFGVVAALLPARRAARLDIVEALRWE
jgi:putative ABC transport system permease protein